MLKRVLLFVLTNLAVIITISIVLNLLGVRPYLTQNGIDYQSLLIFCLVWGFAGAIISLALSRVMAKWMMGVKVIPPGGNHPQQWLYNMVEQIAKSAGLPRTPEVGVYDSPEVNAFATGPTKSRALVAFSAGLLSSMGRDEVEGVAAHEIAHIRNGDMVTMTLLQGVVNAMVLFLSRVIAFAASQAVKEEQAALVRIVVTLLLDICLSLLGSMVVLWFSRQREFRADAGSAKFVGRGKMIAALKSLARNAELAQVGEAHASLATMKISGGRSWMRLFASHPSLEERIAALERMA